MSVDMGRALMAIGCAAAVTAGSCANRDNRTGDETHFFDCHVDGDCRRVGASYLCEDGVCRPRSATFVGSMDSGGGAPAPTAVSSTKPSPNTSDASGAPSIDGGRPSTAGADAGAGSNGVGPSKGPSEAGMPPADGNGVPAFGQVLAGVGGEISAVAMDADALYYASTFGGQAPGYIWRVPKDGSTPAKSLVAAPTDVEGIAVDDGFVYFTDLGAGTINRLAKSGGKPDVIADGQTRPWGIAVDAAVVYWANEGTLGGSSNIGAGIMALSKGAGSQPVTLAANEQICQAIMLDGAGGIVWQNGLMGENGSFRRLALPNGSPISLVTGLGLTSTPAVGQGTVVWSNPSDVGTEATLSSVPITGGTVTTTLMLGSGNGSLPVPVAADGAAVYVGAAEDGLNDGSVEKFSLANGSRSQLSAPVPNVAGVGIKNQITNLLTDASAVFAFDYWTDDAGMHGRVRRVRK